MVEGDVRIDLVCQTSNINRPGAHDGEHVLMATAVTTDAPVERGAVASAVATLIGRWAPGFPWEREAELIEIREHPAAQFRPLPGVRRQLPGARTRLPNVFLAGDYTLHPSLEGAVASGRIAAAAVAATAPRSG
jgi:uncharacterized protein with NAD-binding domain and iron-sulfur cluster